MLAAFAEAASLGCTSAITLSARDDDDLRDLPILLAEARSHPTALIVGYRRRSKTAQSFTRFSNLLLWLETGVHMKDSQHGPRLYPLRLIDTIRGKHKRYLGATDLLAWAAWAGCPIVQVALNPRAKGRPIDQSRSMALHYTLRELQTHAGLLLRELSGLPYPHYEGGIQREPFWRELWQWCNPLRAWRELRQGGATREEMAAGVAVGVFIANIPIYGLQTVAGIYAARRLHLNPVAVVAGTQAAIPPMMPVLVAAAVWVGHLLLHGKCLGFADLNPFHGKFFQHPGPLLLDCLVGCVLVGIASAALSFFVANFLFRFVEKDPAATEKCDADELIPAEEATPLVKEGA